MTSRRREVGTGMDTYWGIRLTATIRVAWMTRYGASMMIVLMIQVVAPARRTRVFSCSWTWGMATLTVAGQSLRLCSLRRRSSQRSQIGDSSMLQSGGASHQCAHSSSRGPAVQYAMQLLQPQIQLREREPTGSYLRNSHSSAVNRISAEVYGEGR